MFHRKRRQSGLRTKYAKIPIKTKLAFLRKVVLQGFSIRDSATVFNINYSTAKTLMRQYKSDAFAYDLRTLNGDVNVLMDGYDTYKRCGYREIGSDDYEKQEPSSNGSQNFSLQHSDNNASQKSNEIRPFCFKKIEIISCTTNL